MTDPIETWEAEGGMPAPSRREQREAALAGTGWQWIWTKHSGWIAQNADSEALIFKGEMRITDCCDNGYDFGTAPLSVVRAVLEHHADPKD